MTDRSDREILASILTARPELFEQRGGVWAIVGDHALVPRLPMSARTAYGDLQVDDQEAGYAVTSDGLAVLDIVGPVSKFASWWRMWGVTTSPTLGELAGAVSAAIADERVTGIMLRIDSPGGTMWGTPELADAVRAAAAVKPVHAYAVDQCCSAAYWIASQADRLTSNAAAEVGSIGTYCVLVDSSGMAAELGLKFVRIRTGQHKGVGVPGVEITDAEVKELQRWIDSANALFLEAVAGGRPQLANSLAKLADGRFWLGAEAHSLGLTDGVETFAAAMEQLRTAVRARGKEPQEGSKMADTAKTPAATAAGTSTTGGGADVAALEARLAELEQSNKVQAQALEQARERELVATVTADLAALADSVPPAIRSAESTKGLLVHLKQTGQDAHYKAALGLVAQADHSALLGEPGAAASDVGAAAGRSTTGAVTAEMRAQLKAGGMTDDEIDEHVAKSGVGELN